MGTGISGIATYIGYHKGEDTIAELQEKVNPDQVATDQKELELGRFREALKNSNPIKEFFPRALGYEYNEEDWDEIERYIEAHVSSKHKRLLIDLMATKCPRRLINSEKLYFLFGRSNDFFLLANNDNERRLALKDGFNIFNENRTKINALVFRKVLHSAYNSRAQYFDPKKFFLKELPDQKSRGVFNYSQTIEISDEFTQKWGINNAYHFSGVFQL